MRDFLIASKSEKDFFGWAKLKSEIHFTRDVRKVFFHTREIWWANLGVNIGHEEDGKNFHFERPVLIIKKFNQHLALSVPLSTSLKDNLYYCHFPLGGGLRSAMISQIRLISSKRLIRRIGDLNRSDFRQVVAKIKNIF
ncbi:MAG: type II toxin-antitoxin system PemK/MazF family toxin [Patescibacteria group bacterium]